MNRYAYNKPTWTKPNLVHLGGVGSAEGGSTSGYIEVGAMSIRSAAGGPTSAACTSHFNSAMSPAS